MARNTTSTDAPQRVSKVRVPRSRGALTGILLILLGAWGALIPFVGPYFNFSFSPNVTWHWTTARLWLEVLPGAVAFVGGFMLLSTANRAVAVLGGWLATAAGAWFVVGPVASTLWSSIGSPGTPIGTHTRQVVEQLSFFYALGAVILILAAHASGRLAVRSVRDVRAAERAQPYPSSTSDDQTTADAGTATSHRG
jgi:hypothetical protein